jgi:hypothetical protein
VQTVAAAFEDPCLKVGKVVEGIVGCFGRCCTSFDLFVQEEIAHRAIEQKVTEVITDGKIYLFRIVSIVEMKHVDSDVPCMKG